MEIITTLPEGNYEGYLWLSDENAPKVLNKEYLAGQDLTIVKNPFIIEAQLYNRDTEDSYSIRFIDNAYIATHFNIKDINGDSQQHSFLANFDGAPGKLQFITVWREEEDLLCEGMSTLTPKEFIFVGFEK